VGSKSEREIPLRIKKRSTLGHIPRKAGGKQRGESMDLTGLKKRKKRRCGARVR